MILKMQHYVQCKTELTKIVHENNYVCYVSVSKDVTNNVLDSSCIT